MKKPTGAGALFVVVAVVPTALSALYYGLIASDVYVSESRYVIRSTDKNEAPSIGAFLRSGGAAAAGGESNANIVSQYLLSRDAMALADKSVGLRHAYSDNTVDFLSRFPGVFEPPHMESFYEYYKRHVKVTVEALSGASTLVVRAYDPKTARDANEALLRGAEAVVNEMNARMRADKLDQSQREVSEAEARLIAAEMAIASFRGSRRVINPEQEAMLQLQRRDRLRESLLEARSRLEEILAVAPQSPQIPVLKRRVEAIEREISRISDRAVGVGGASLADESARFQKLLVEREIASKRLALAIDRLEAAKNDAQRQQLYLERIAGPSVPDGAMEPRRWRAVAATFVISLLVWGVLTVLAAGIRAHKGVG